MHIMNERDARKQSFNKVEGDSGGDCRQQAMPTQGIRMSLT